MQSQQPMAKEVEIKNCTTFPMDIMIISNTAIQPLIQELVLNSSYKWM